MKQLVVLSRLTNELVIRRQESVAAGFLGRHDVKRVGLSESDFMQLLCPQHIGGVKINLYGG